MTVDGRALPAVQKVDIFTYLAESLLDPAGRLGKIRKGLIV